MTSLSTGGYKLLDSINNENSYSAPLLKTVHSSNPFVLNRQKGFLSRSSEYVSAVNHHEHTCDVDSSNYSPIPIEPCLQECLLSQGPEKGQVNNIPQFQHYDKSVKSVSTGNNMAVAWLLKKDKDNSSRVHIE